MLRAMARSVSPVSAADRRGFFSTIAALSAAAAAAPALAAAADGSRDAQEPVDDDAPDGAAAVQGSITASTIAEAERLAGIAFTDAERAQMTRTIAEQTAWFRARAAFGALDGALAPAQVFRALLPGERPLDRIARATQPASAPPAPPAPKGDDDLDWATVSELGAWLRAGHVTSRRLVERSIARLKAADPTLHCVITLCEPRALAEADARDAELASGRVRGPLHGVPYGLKDLFDTAGIATTWGAEPWRDRVPATDASVVARLREAGAVCVAKLAVGALAYGDIWFGGTCRNPWNPEQGSSGSSAGSASAVAAGCVPFAIGTETLGSIVSPSVRCGTTGLRPTFGRVARDGCMALCWSWDKVGPITRSVVDTGLVLAAINGSSDLDASSVEAPFHAPAADEASAKGMTLAYDPRWFDGPAASARDAIAAARDAGATVVERTLDLPGDPSVLLVSLMSEAAAAFEEMTRSGADDRLSWQADEAWPNSFRQTWFVPAIELVQVERLRRTFMHWMRGALDGVDALILPPFAGGLLFVTNATGHPQLVLRGGFDGPGRPRAVSLIGHPFDEATLVRAGAAIEARLAVARERPETPWFQGI
jgi:Asp-tRNA(Asn)/Glu-tRNA(Gln) amidotransferase A subunit family amidase